jgi:hypothetical protein
MTPGFVGRKFTRQGTNARRPLNEIPLASLFYPTVLDSYKNIDGKHRPDKADKKYADIHWSPRFRRIFQPIRVRNAPRTAAPQLAGEIITPTKHPTPKVKNHVSQYFIRSPPHK